MEKKILTKKQKRIEIERQLRAHFKELLPEIIKNIDQHLDDVNNTPLIVLTKDDLTIKNIIVNKYIKSEENFKSFVSWFEAIIDRPMTDEEKQRARNNSITKF